MKPPICELCGKRFETVAGDSLVRFSDYKPLPEGTVGHPHGLAWFCPDHIEAARALADLPTAEAMKRLRGKTLKPMQRLTGLLILTAWLVSIGIILYAAQLWEATELLHDFRGMLYFLGWCVWISLPFLLLWILNRKLAVTPLLEKLLLFAALPGALLPAWLYIQAVFIDAASTSVLAFAAVPAYQLLFTGLVAIGCLILWRRGRSAERDRQPTND